MKLNLTEQFKEIFVDYTDAVVEATIDAIEKVAEKSADELRSSSPQDSGKYAKGWTSETERHRTFASATVMNKKRYQLTHLLEYGHAKTNGGRVDGIPHIGEVNENAQEEAIKEITKAIERIR